ncbi:peptidase M17 [Candidatus Sulfidibacterium hydrothermale]|uniref:leucyl aminopeptidase family protein n=1 Tax=Candidatus Sulfidibacterium hydrothermale TaxID=2875962 RepID=UPI001F0A0A35|nr:peptidase M17 [Candidatus Sulfidibacterium hydrothermale]UBM62657.1 peptidase M17 [Candidatus Sulfidibacterium hydrothermale]
MDTILKKALRKPTAADTIFLVKDGKDLTHLGLTEEEINYVKKQHRLNHNVVSINRYKNVLTVVFGEVVGTRAVRLEAYRQRGDEAQAQLNQARVERTVIFNVSVEKEETLAFTEGFLLGNYAFNKYKKPDKKKDNTIEEVDVYDGEVTEEDLQELQIVLDAVYAARNWVNEPVSYLTATQFAEEIKALAQQAGAKVEIFNKKKLESLKFGGLLAVNRGSVEPPTFTIVEWKPKNAKNKKPYVFVGKGVVYDTGGLSLKPTNFMDTMKSDMAGGAAVAAALYAIAKAKLPVYVVGLIPATDNRPDGNAYTPGDVITMHDGSTVEVLNTDAEGRMILADALSYAKEYNPELVIDMATLTGAAARAIGPQAIVGMEAKADDDFENLKKVAALTHERIVEFPFWDEYKEALKSKIADLKNIGGVEAGAITAGKFLEHFTAYPYIHLDIAGPAFLDKKDSYRGVGGTGVGVRLFYHFIRFIME